MSGLMTSCLFQQGSHHLASINQNKGDEHNKEADRINRQHDDK